MYYSSFLWEALLVLQGSYHGGPPQPTLTCDASIFHCFHQHKDVHPFFHCKLQLLYNNNLNNKNKLHVHKHR